MHCRWRRTHYNWPTIRAAQKCWICSSANLSPKVSSIFGYDSGTTFIDFIYLDQVKWWSNSYNKPNSRPSKTISVEITSYGLLALIKANRLADALPYFRWLLTQRNDQGGFEGTQDTALGLEALAKYAEHLSTKDNNVQLRVKTSEPQDINLSVNNENVLLLQSAELKPHEKNVQIFASGHGFALAQLSYRYHVNDSDALASFILEPKLSADSSPGHIRVDICAT